MGIYYNTNLILGLRILLLIPNNFNNYYYVKYEFTGDNWRKDAMRIVSHYIDKEGVKIQTLHPFSESFNIQTGQINEASNIWLDNYYLNKNDLWHY
jgi:hypothetical protein